MTDDQPVGPRSGVARRAVRLHRRRHRAEAGRFLAEGPQAVREALATGAVEEILTTEDGRESFRTLLPAADGGARVHILTADGLARACDAVAPQAIAAICRTPSASLESITGSSGGLLVALAGCADPGNMGTIVRIADAVGAAGVVVSSDSVDPYSPKAVRASAGSIFHVPVAVGVDIDEAVSFCGEAGIQTIAAVVDGADDVFGLAATEALSRPTMWLFGSEANGLCESLLASCPVRASIPIYGRAQSLNLAAAAAICLYQSARAQAEARALAR